jgi:hypothetical protein
MPQQNSIIMTSYHIHIFVHSSEPESHTRLRAQIDSIYHTKMVIICHNIDAVYHLPSRYKQFTACSDSEFNFWTYVSIWTFGRTPWTGGQPGARPLPTQDNKTQKNADTHPCPKRDSNPHYQCSSGRRQYEMQFIWTEIYNHEPLQEVYG